MTSSRSIPFSEVGKTSPSFLIALLAVALGVVGVVGWGYLFPNPNKRSEQIVRESRPRFNKAIRNFERDIGDITKKAGLDSSQRIAAVEERAVAAKREIDEAVDEARAQLADLDIALRTHQNRADRIDDRADEAKAMIDERVEEKRVQFSGGS